MQGGETSAKGHSVPVTLTVSRADAETRSELSENEDGTLSDVWKEGDKLAVYSADGKIYHGDLDITEGQDTSEGVFTGILDNVSDGTADYYLWYVNRDNSRIERSKDSYNVFIYNIDYYNQNFSSITDLSKMDVLNKKISLSVKGSTATVVKDYTMEAKLAMIHFSLDGDLSNVSGTLKIYDDNRSVKCPVTRGYYRVTSINNVPAPGNHDDSYTCLEAQVNNGEVYFAMQPCKAKFRFEYDNNGKTYNYAFENVTDLKAGYYYSTVLSLETEAEEEVLDHSKNPLALWAESDLMNDGKTSGANYKSTFTGAYGTTGDYYQFGRNKGWMNCADIKNQYSKTAVALMNSNWSGAGSYASFYCSEYGTVVSTNLYNPYRGTGDTQTGNWYNASTKMANLPEYFMYAGNESLGNWSGEYVFDSTIRNTHTWAERAKYCGYANDDPCPEGWRIPKLEDWRKILPSGGHEYSKGATSDFSEISEIKNDGDVKYAIRWNRYVTSSGSQYLKIDALVVPSTVTSTDNVDWTDANVVTRYFKGAGAIKPSFFLARLVSGSGWNKTTTYEWVAQPQPICKFDYAFVSAGSGYVTVQTTITRDDTKLGGYYWIDDVQQYAMGFRFDENNLQQQGSYINVFKFNQPYACNIRCIKK